MSRVKIPPIGRERVKGVPTPHIPRATFHGIDDPETILTYKCVLNYVTPEELLYIKELESSNHAQYTTIVDNLNLLCYKDKYFKTFPNDTARYTRLIELNPETAEYVGILEEIYTIMKQMEHRYEQAESKKRGREVESNIKYIEDNVVHSPINWTRVDTGKGVKMPRLTEELSEQKVPYGSDIIAALNARANSRYPIWGGREIKRRRKTKQRKTKRGAFSFKIFSKYLRSGKNTKRKRRTHKH